MRARLSVSPTVFALAGAVAIAFSAILYRLADEDPSTLQLVGVVAILAGLLLASASRRESASPA